MYIKVYSVLHFVICSLSPRLSRMQPFGVPKLVALLYVNAEPVILIPENIITPAIYLENVKPDDQEFPEVQPTLHPP
jgi:hypothetical protein